MTTDIAGRSAGHFAASGNPHAPACAAIARGPVARGYVRRARERAANDNALLAGPGDPRIRASAARHAAPSEETLRAALDHFAQHGLGAARAARVRAEAAFFAGDRPGYRWWLEITRTLDRRLAAEVERAAGA